MRLDAILPCLGLINWLRVDHDHHGLSISGLDYNLAIVEMIGERIHIEVEAEQKLSTELLFVDTQNVFL